MEHAINGTLHHEHKRGSLFRITSLAIHNISATSLGVISSLLPKSQYARKESSKLTSMSCLSTFTRILLGAPFVRIPE